MKRKGIQYIIAFFLLLLFVSKGTLPLLDAVLSDKEITEMVAELENEESKKSSRQSAEAGIQEWYTILHYFTGIDGGEVLSRPIIPSWKNTIYKQKVFLSIPTPPPKAA